MNLLPLLTLVWTFPSAAEALRCRSRTPSAAGSFSSTCGIFSSCATAAVKGTVFGPSAVFRSCVSSSFCSSRTRIFSFSFGQFNHAAALRCCSSDNCNNHNVSVPEEKRNTLRCNSCSGADCKYEVQCVGNQDRCFSGVALLGRIQTPVFGCASESICTGHSSNIPHFLSPANFSSRPTCCKTSLCNAPALKCLDNIKGVRRCPSPYHLCATAAVRANASSSIQTRRSCVSPSLCSSSSSGSSITTFSYNFGSGNSGAALRCCSTDTCNTHELTFSPGQATNSLKCFTCGDAESGVCNDTLQCVGVQDRCISASVVIGATRTRVYGCASSSVCSSSADWDFLGLFKDAKKLKCCRSSFCNSAGMVKVSVAPLLLQLVIFSI